MYTHTHIQKFAKSEGRRGIPRGNAKVQGRGGESTVFGPVWDSDDGEEGWKMGTGAALGLLLAVRLKEMGREEGRRGSGRTPTREKCRIGMRSAGLGRIAGSGRTAGSGRIAGCGRIAGSGDLRACCGIGEGRTAGSGRKASNRGFWETPDANRKQRPKINLSTFVFFLSQIIDYGVHKLWEYKNVGGAVLGIDGFSFQTLNRRSPTAGATPTRIPWCDAKADRPSFVSPSSSFRLPLTVCNTLNKPPATFQATYFSFSAPPLARNSLAKPSTTLLVFP
ncbi:hypothetical protein KSP39_PZI001573 [Platanthera zijinensis]|uniref:Uncharacterized protein n=1 Tax=Platanthera zijinensis TaxID=2320716 RepID=A0AAP0BZD0_9ASPA